MTFPQGPSVEETSAPRPMAAPDHGMATGVVTPFPVRPSTTTSAYQTVAWRAPTATRFDGRPANDFLTRAEAVVPLRTYRAMVADPVSSAPGWTTFVIGACIAALLGAVLGGMMSV